MAPSEMLTLDGGMPRSAAMQCLTLLWQHRDRWITQRQQTDGMRQGLQLILQMGLPCGLEDFVWLSTTRGATAFHPSPCGFATWCTGGLREGYYRTAIEAHHTSACLAYEHWRGRTPFFWQGQRLFVGAWFDWQGQRALVTSFDDQAGTLTACAYATISCSAAAGGARHEVGQGAPTHRYTLTPRQLRQASHTA